MEVEKELKGFVNRSLGLLEKYGIFSVVDYLKNLLLEGGNTLKRDVIYISLAMLLVRAGKHNEALRYIDKTVMFSDSEIVRLLKADIALACGNYPAANYFFREVYGDNFNSYFSPDNPNYAKAKALFF